MSPESYALMVTLTVAALLLAALGALLLFKGAREESERPSLILTDGRIRIGGGANGLRFRLEALPSGHAAFRAEMSGRVSDNRFGRQKDEVGGMKGRLNAPTSSFCLPTSSLRGPHTHLKVEEASG